MNREEIKAAITRLHDVEGLSYVNVTNKLAELGVVNPQTGAPYTAAHVYNIAKGKVWRGPGPSQATPRNLSGISAKAIAAASILRNPEIDEAERLKIVERIMA